MSVPLIPGPLAELGRRRFSLYPAIVGVEHNEWMLRRATTAEVDIVNTKSKVELSIPRRFVGEVSRVEAPVMIVGLVKELECKAGMVVPHRRQVIEMPHAVNEQVGWRRPAANGGSCAPVVAIRLDPGSESRTARRFLGSIAAGLLACVGVGIGVRDAHLGARSPAAAQETVLQPEDDYRAVVNKLGSPAFDRWQNLDGMVYRRLFYPQRRLIVILAGTTRDNVHYSGKLTTGGALPARVGR